jgi:uronate dehydrogenase
MHRVLITGAAGDIGGRLRALLAGRYPVLRLSDVKRLDPAGAAEEVVTTDLGDFDAVDALCQDVDGIVHLGGISGESDWTSILDANIVGTYNLFEAAKRQGVKRVVFASSNHAIGFYRRDQVIGSDVTPLPDSRYGLSKAFGESLGALYAHKYGLEVFCMRIGNITDQPVDKRRLSIWVSPRDLAALVQIGLEHPAVKYEIVYGVSDNARSFWDNEAAERLGYRPQDRAEDFAEAVLAEEPDHAADDVTEIYQGGTFVTAEQGGNPNQPPPQD